MDEGEGDEERALAATKLQARIRGNEARKVRPRKLSRWVMRSGSGWMLPL